MQVLCLRQPCGKRVHCSVPVTFYRLLSDWHRTGAAWSVVTCGGFLPLC